MEVPVEEQRLHQGDVVAQLNLMFIFSLAYCHGVTNTAGRVAAFNGPVRRCPAWAHLPRQPPAVVCRRWGGLCSVVCRDPRSFPVYYDGRPLLSPHYRLWCSP